MVSLQGLVVSGLGQGARFMTAPWVRQAIRQLLEFDPYPGTFNVRLVDPDMLVTWRRIREGSALLLAPPPPETCGARLVRVVLVPDVTAAVVVPDITRYGDDVLELVAGMHVRNRFGLQDDDPVTLQVPMSARDSS